MARKKISTGSTNPNKSGSKPKAKNGPDENGQEKRGKHKLQQLPTEAGPVLFGPFMNLPTEIRQMVYDFTLTENRQPVLVDQWNVDAPWGRSPPTSLPKLSTGLMGVCHKIREEIGHSYYILNGFRFIQPSTLIDWLRDPNRRDHLRSIACRLNLDSTWFKSSCEVLRLLHLCVSLVTLRINANPADLRILQHFEKFKPLHGFASAEAILFPQGDPDDSHLWPASSVHIWTRQHDLQPILAQLRSRCPDNCAGHARRERVEIRVMPSNMSPW